MPTRPNAGERMPAAGWLDAPALRSSLLLCRLDWMWCGWVSPLAGGALSAWEMHINAAGGSSSRLATTCHMQSRRSLLGTQGYLADHAGTCLGAAAFVANAVPTFS